MAIDLKTIKTFLRMPSRLAWDSALVSGFTGLGALIGLGVDVLIALRFGLSQETDAYFAALTLPVAILTAVLLSSQNVLIVALAHSMTLTGLQTAEDAPSLSPSTLLFSNLCSLAGLSGLALAGLGILLSPLLMRLLAPGFNSSTLALAGKLSQILFLCVPAEMISAVLQSAFYARRRFALGASANFLPGMIHLGVLLAAPLSALSLAWALVAGSWLGFLVLLAMFGWARVQAYRPVLALDDQHTRQTLRSLAAPLAGLLFRQLVLVGERWFGSFLGAGSVAALGYANKITRVLAGTVFDSVATAGLPALSEAIARGSQEAARRSARRLMWLSLAAAVPLGLALALASGPLVDLLFTRGGRDLAGFSAQSMAVLLAVYALSMIPLGPFRARQSFLYASGRAGRVAGLLGIATVVTLLLDAPLVYAFGPSGLGVAFGMGTLVALFASLRSA